MIDGLVKAKEAERQELQDDVDRFLSNGGKIKSLDAQARSDVQDEFQMRSRQTLRENTEYIEDDEDEV
jgi:hypothetical protein